MLGLVPPNPIPMSSLFPAGVPPPSAPAPLPAGEPSSPRSARADEDGHDSDGGAGVTGHDDPSVLVRCTLLLFSSYRFCSIWWFLCPARPFGPRLSPARLSAIRTLVLVILLSLCLWFSFPLMLAGPVDSVRTFVCQSARKGRRQCHGRILVRRPP